jgi:hypothetical protein
MRTQGFSEADEILWMHLNEAMAWGANFRYQMNAMDTTSGRTSSNRPPAFVLRKPQPSNKLPQMAIADDRL